MNNWTDWQSITEISVGNSAVYQVRIVDADLKPHRIKRFLGDDYEGIICIGESSNMEQRRKQFISGIDRANGHSSMNLVYYLKKYTCFNEVFGSYTFQYRYSTCDEYERKSIESDITKNYVKQFGEVPPLNSVIPDRYKKWADR